MDPAAQAHRGHGGRRALPLDTDGLWACALEATLAPVRSTVLIPVAEHACRHLDGGPWHGLALWALGGQQFVHGDSRAAETFAAAAFEAERSASTILLANCIVAGAVAAELAGGRDEAEAAAARAQAILRAAHFELIPMTAAVRRCTPWARLGWGGGTRRPRRWRSPTSSSGGASRWRRGSTSWLGWPSSARACCSTIGRPAGCCSGRSSTTCGRAAGRWPGGDRRVTPRRRPVPATHVLPDAVWLTPAELRVLELLPTNLPLREVASQLFVSRNTVKSHTAAIYRKLGAASRSGTAVDPLARRACLIDEPGLEPRR